ncbi:hypothetical protein LY90DRAFT_676197 [Neocallimastix californiae]|jgi:hypothetical protein|uniref:RlpA-like protein double-psi beta-barrel domain-containing protein n=1 Tax=Neocallimastix californiae TaxID=1754190 RepID=A0A1Y2AGL1_9FUNG|nr:hypothetical protein LY90DRAFT_676197 [Neocallimastix californiae]|eukprot:ORY21622.1 hypothetical protein LY90DRAFT_676197 [Neocallimastix californiae]
MKFNVLILSLLLNLALVYSKSTEKNNANVFTISSSPLCETKKLDKNQKLYYASVPSKLAEKSCNKYVVAMNADPASKGKYRLVKAAIRDECKQCSSEEVMFSIKALKDISGSRKANIFWAILSEDGELFKGPFKPELSDSERKELQKISGEKSIDDIMERFTEMATDMILSKKVHEKEFPWGDAKEKKTTPTKSSKKNIKSTVIVKKVTVTDIKKVLVVKTRSQVNKVSPTHASIPTEAKTEENTKETTNNGSSAIAGTVAVSVAAGATLLLIRRKSAKKNYIFGEPIDEYDSSTAKKLYAKTKDGQHLKINIPINDFSDIAHIQIFSPNRKESIPNLDVYNVHNERAIASNNNSNDSISVPQPQEQPKPHLQLPAPSNDFMLAFSPIEHPDIAALPKENIGNYDCTKITSRITDDPYLTQYNGDDNQEIYSSVPKEMNKVYANNSRETSTDILLEYVEEEEY